jgi:hypothetical protein
MTAPLSESNIKTLNNTDHLGSSKYVPIQTSELVHKFTNEGFQLVGMKEARYKKAEKESKVKHVVRMSLDQDEEVRRDIVIMNAADGSSSLRLHMGLHRFSCANGMIICDDLIPSARIVHSNKDPMRLVDEFIVLMRSKLGEEQRVRRLMMKRHLTAEQEKKFAYEAVALREDDMSIVLDPMSANIVRRPSDRGNSVWTIMNRLQESVINGDSYRKLSVSYDEDGIAKERYLAAQKLTDQARIITVNKALHSLAMKYMEINYKKGLR